MVHLLIQMPPELKKINAFFYKTENGKEPVREWLKELSREHRREIGQDIATEGDFLMKRKEAIDSSFDSFLKEEGAYEATQAVAIKRVLTWQIEKEMKKRHIAKNQMARLMRTSRSQLDRLLDPTNGSVTLSTLARAGQVLGKEIRLQLT